MPVWGWWQCISTISACGTLVWIFAFCDCLYVIKHVCHLISKWFICGKVLIPLFSQWFLPLQCLLSPPNNYFSLCPNLKCSFISPFDFFFPFLVPLMYSVLPVSSFLSWWCFLSTQTKMLLCLEAFIDQTCLICWLHSSAEQWAPLLLRWET